MKKKQVTNAVRYLFVFLLLFFLLIVAVIVNVNGGSVDISPMEIFRIIFFRAGEGEMASNVIWKIRLPRL